METTAAKTIEVVAARTDVGAPLGGFDPVLFLVPFSLP